LNLQKNPNDVAITNQYASRNFNATPGSVNRYTLTNEGNVLLSLMRADPTLNANFDRKCLDSFANLKPLCAPCNNAKGNTLKYV
jgi:hypothetical protein